jgi:FKBP-type peptidyl-prolyl cis-trans isomerase (trigger factor)
MLVGKFVDEPEAEDIKVDDVEVVLGGPGVQQEFTENLTGVNADDHARSSSIIRQTSLHPAWPARKLNTQPKSRRFDKRDYPSSTTNGSRVWVESLTQSKRSRRRCVKISKREHARVDHNLRDEVIRKLLDAHQFEVPQSLIEQQTQTRLEGVVRQMMSRGIDPRSQQLDWERAREELKGSGRGRCALFDAAR